MREPLQKVRRAALLEARGSVDDEVLLQAWRLKLGAFERDRHTRVMPDVAQLLLRRVEMAGNDVVALEADPNAADLRGTVGGQRDQMGQGARLQDPSGLRRELDPPSVGNAAAPTQLARRASRADCSSVFPCSSGFGFGGGGGTP